MVSNVNAKGKISYPASYGFGGIYHAGEKWMIGVDYSQTQWSGYRYFGETDDVQDSRKLNIGGQLTPNLSGAKTYWGRVTYRAGVAFGQDYIK